MPEQEIASIRWRKRLRDWSRICDNGLKLDRTGNLSGTPAKLNSFAICSPECEMCVTPQSVVTCDNGLRQSLSPYMEDLPITPAFIPIPSQRWQVDILGDQVVSGTGNPCLPPGGVFTNLYGQSSTKRFILYPSGNTEFQSEWKPFGTSTVTLNFKGFDFGSDEPQYEKTVQCTYSTLIKCTLRVSTKLNRTCFFAAINQEIKTGFQFPIPLGPPIFLNNSADWYWRNLVVTQQLSLPVVRNSFLELFDVGSNALHSPIKLSPATSNNGVNWRVNSPFNDRIQNFSDFKSTYEPFEFFWINYGCGPTILHSSVTYNCVVDFRNQIADPANFIVTTVETTPGTSWGSAFKLTPIL